MPPSTMVSQKSRTQPLGKEHITPSKQTIFATLAVLVPIALLFVSLFNGTINP
ncbi:MAG TPA: hypothetical protein V6D19_13525 [Stenomitos sp.]